MAEHSKFFDSLNPLDPDKVYTADEFLGFFGKLITDGVMKGEANMLKVETSGSNMNTIVDTGTAFLKAREYENDSKLSLTHEVEALGKSRIDRVVIRLMLHVDYREARAFVKKGVAGVAPVVPQLERTDDVYEISLAQVKVIGGQTYINVADVVDERGTVGICPWAGSKILPNFDNDTVENLFNPVELKLPLMNGAVGEIVFKRYGFGLVSISVDFWHSGIPEEGVLAILPEGSYPYHEVVIPLVVRKIPGTKTQVAGTALVITPTGEIILPTKPNGYPGTGSPFPSKGAVTYSYVTNP